jgi:hypothetical protein
MFKICQFILIILTLGIVYSTNYEQNMNNFLIFAEENLANFKSSKFINAKCFWIANFTNIYDIQGLQRQNDTL